MCVCDVMSRPRPGKNKQRHVDCYDSQSSSATPGSSGPSSPVAPRRLTGVSSSTIRGRLGVTAQPGFCSRLVNGVRATRQLRPRVGSSGSGADSPHSQDTPRLRSGSALSSPLRSSRQGTSSPGDDLSDDSGIRVQRGTYQSMYQDVINIKALLLRLSRVVQEQSESDLSNNETCQIKNGFHPTSVDSHTDTRQQEERIVDLERQVVFLRSQLEEERRTVRTLQTTQPPPEPRGRVDTCNAATQTERVRPLSTGPILSTQSDSSGGSFVSNSSEPVRSLQRPVSRLPQWRHSPTDQHIKPLPTVRKQT